MRSLIARPSQKFQYLSPRAIQQLGQHDKPQDTISKLRIATPTASISSGISDTHRLGTPKIQPGVNAILEREQSQVLLRHASLGMVANPMWTVDGCKFEISLRIDFSIFVYLSISTSILESHFLRSNLG